MALEPLDVHARARAHTHTHAHTPTHTCTRRAQTLYLLHRPRHRPPIFYKIDSRIDLNVKWQNTEFLEENSRKSR